MLIVLVLAGAAILVFAVGGDESEADLSDSELREALLAADDLDGEYTANEPENDGAFDPDEADASEECIDLMTEANANEQENPELQYEPADQADPSVRLGLTGPYEDRPEFSTAAELLEVCDEIHIDDGQSVGDMRLSAADDVDIDLGSETIVAEVEFELEQPAPLTLHGYIVYWNRDGIYGALQVFGGYRQEGNSFVGLEVDTALVEKYAEAADEKLADAIENAD